MSEVKREKRRLDDLLTLREDEIVRLKENDKLKLKNIVEKDSAIAEFERKIKHIEKKYEKTIAKLSIELSKYKKIPTEANP